MLKPLAVYIGLRYTKAKKNNHFVSFISLSSMLGIALGVMVLITVLSVMNGFDEEIHKRFFGMAPEITINGFDERLRDWQSLEQKLLDFPGVRTAAPFVGGQGLMSYDGRVRPVIISGILPEKEQGVSQLRDKMVVGDLKNLTHFGVVLGQSLADMLGVTLGDKVTIMIPQATATPAGMIPRFKRFTVQGIFAAGPGFGFETGIAYIDLHDAQKLMQLGQDVSGMKLRIANIYQAPQLAEKIATQLTGDFQVSNWTRQFGAFFQAVKMEKTMMFLILLLIIAVAAFNLVSSLVMVVNDKQAEIAILRTIGATPRLILSIFIVQGMMVGVIGLIIGIISGLLLAYNATEIVEYLQHFFEIQVLSSNIYFVDYLPSKIMWQDVMKVCIAALSMSFLATIYPAWRASRTMIAEALHYE